MSFLTKAAGKWDAAFSALSPEARTRIGLAIYRAYPAIQQYSADLAPLTAAPGIKAATWDLLIAFAIRVVKKQSRAFEFSEKELAELMERAPAVADFARNVVKALEDTPVLAAAVPERKKLR